jgi:obg-like ATPase 1
MLLYLFAWVNADIL